MSLPTLRRPRPFLSLRDASFRLGDRLVFEHTTWTFGRAEHWAVLGANGSGKSLLADALRGRLPLVRGELRYHFQPPPGLSPEEAISHVSFEHRKAETHAALVQSRWNSLDQAHALRVRDFLSYEQVMEVNPFEVTARHRHARPSFERRMRRAVALLGLAPFLDRRLMSLSNGERGTSSSTPWTPSSARVPRRPSTSPTASRRSRPPSTGYCAWPAAARAARPARGRTGAVAW